MGSAPNHAEAVRWYRIENQSEVQDRLREAVAYAESVGWQIEQRPTGAYVGQRELGPGMGQVIVSVGAEDPLDDLDGAVCPRDQPELLSNSVMMPFVLIISL